MSFEEAEGHYQLETVYAEAQVKAVDEVIRTRILDFLGETADLKAEDVETFFLGKNIKRASPDYFKLLESLIGSLLRHLLVQGHVVEDFTRMFGSCADRMSQIIRAQRKADILSNADLPDFFSIVQLGTMQKSIRDELGSLQERVETAGLNNGDLVQPFQELEGRVRQHRDRLEEALADLQARLQLLEGPGEPQRDQGPQMEAPGQQPPPMETPELVAEISAALAADRKRPAEGEVMVVANKKATTQIPQVDGAGAKDEEEGGNRGPMAPPPPENNQGGQIPPGRQPRPPAGGPPPPPPPQGGAQNQQQGQQAHRGGAQAQHQFQQAVALPPGGAKCPKLDSIEPARFEEFCFNFRVYADMMAWDDHMRKVNAILSLSGKASEHLRCLVPNWRLPQVTLEHLFDTWTNRILPQAQVEVARKQVTTMTQRMDESFDDYILRGLELHRYAYGRDLGHAAAENDLDFIIRLTAGLLDRNIRSHVERARPTSLSTFRELVHKEAAIAMDPTSRSGYAGINALEEESVNAMDAYRSHTKPLPPCELCNDKLHATSGCRLLVKYKELHEKELKEQRKKRQNARNARGRGRGRGRGRFFSPRPTKDGEPEPQKESKPFVKNEPPKN